MYAKAVPEGYRPYDMFYATKNRYKGLTGYIYSAYPFSVKLTLAMPYP
jgi:hypothetical protein